MLGSAPIVKLLAKVREELLTIKKLIAMVLLMPCCGSSAKWLHGDYERSVSVGFALGWLERH